MFEISKFKKSDAEQWKVLWAGYQEDENLSDEEVLRQVNTNWPRILHDDKCHSSVLRHEETGHVVGFALFEVQWVRDDERDKCYLSDLYVMPKYQGKGGGRMLINSVVDFARNNNLKQLYWITRPSNKQAQKLYNSYGDSETWLKYKVRI